MRNKILSVMPYILGILILILVVVIIFTQLGSSDSQNNTDKPGETEQTAQAVRTEQNAETSEPGNTGADDVTTPEPAETAATEEISSDVTTDPADVQGEAQIQEAEATDVTDPQPTAEPTATPEPTPVDLTYGYKFEEKSDFVDTMDGVNLRLGASTETKAVAFLEEGKRLERSGYNSEWTRVIYNGEECYIATRLIVREVKTIDEPVPEADNAEDATDKATDTQDATDKTADAQDATDKTADAQGATDKTADTQGDSSDTEKQSEAGTEETKKPELKKVSYYGAGAGKTVCLDSGHQTHGNSSTEPVGPGSSEMKAKVSSGTEGVSTKIPEYELNMAVTQMLKAELIARGYNVVMTHESNDVNISNVERTAIANGSGADVFVRIHANGSESSDANGIETICMTTENPYNASLHGESYKLSKSVLDNTVSRTGAKKRYVWETDTMSGINWSEIPVTIVEMGYMTNPDEDRKLADSDYRMQIVVGIADGIDQYFSN